MSATFTLPTLDDFASELETLITFIDKGTEDTLGRRQFAAFWIDQDRIRAQVFRTDLKQFIRREEMDHRETRIVRL